MREKAKSKPDGLDLNHIFCIRLFYNLFFVSDSFSIFFVSDLFTMFVYGRDACFNCVRTFPFYCSSIVLLNDSGTESQKEIRWSGLKSHFCIILLYNLFFVSDFFTMFVCGRDACFNCVRTFPFYCSLSAALWYNKSTKAFYPIQLKLVYWSKHTCSEWF